MGQAIRKRRKSSSEIAFILFGITIPILSVIFFWIIINFNGILLAFKKHEGSSVVWSLDNFRFVWDAIVNPNTKEKIGEGLRNTFIWFFFGLFVQMPTAYIISFFVYKKIPFANGFRFIFMIPSMVSAVVMTSFVKFMLSAGGPIPELLFALSGENIMPLADSRYAMPTMLVYTFWSTFGSGIILYVATFSRIPQSLVEAGRLDGMGFWKEIVNIVFPLTWPLFSTMLLLQFCGFLGASGPVLLFTKGQFGTYTLSYWIFEQTQGGAGLNKGAALGLVMTVVSLPVVLIFKRLADKVEPIEY